MLPEQSLEVVDLAVGAPPLVGRGQSLDALDMDQQKITGFQEKPQGDGGRINGGFFVLSPGVFDYIEGDDTVWESEPLETLAREGMLSAYLHDGFWQPMDTLRDRNMLESLWESGAPPWKVWA